MRGIAFTAKRTNALLLIGGALLLAAAPVFAQNAPAPPNSAAPASQQNQPPLRTTLRSRTDLVVVPVTVKDKQGEVVGDLKESEFHLLEDGTERQLALFSAEELPLSAVILIDNDLAQKPAQQVQRSLRAIAGGFGPDDNAAIMVYDSYPQLASNFTADNDKLFAALKRLQLGSHEGTIYSSATTAGPTINGQPVPTGTGPARHGSARPANDIALDDAMLAAADLLKNQGRGRRKVIFLISDGSNSQHNQHSPAEALQALLSEGINVFAIAVTHSIPLGPFGRSPLNRKGSTPRMYADNTGGDTFYAGKQRDLERLYSAVAEEARSQYTLAFAPTREDMNHDYHGLEVRIERPGLNVLAPQGYYLSAIRPTP